MLEAVFVLGAAAFVVMVASIPFLLLWDFLSAFFDLPGGAIPPKPKKKGRQLPTSS